MSTKCENIPLNEPLRFLKSTVTSFNCSLGLGSQESTLNVDLVDDCDPEVEAVAGSFQPTNDSFVGVGAPVYFPDNGATAGMDFKFGGVLTNWTIQQNNSGKTYNAKVSDPRQLLENAIIVIDSYLGPPIKGLNYFNVYSYFEEGVYKDGNCNTFGDARSNERGMPYSKIIQALTNIDPTIYAPATAPNGTPYAYKIDFGSFPGMGGGRAVPDWYRVAGPSISVLQLLQDISDVLAYEFYVDLIKFGNDNVITVGLIDLSIPPSSFSGIGNFIDSLNCTATDLSYGQELRNEKTKMVLFGEQVHYLSRVKDFQFFFGEEFNPVKNKMEPIVPYKKRNEPGADCGFWIKKRIQSVNVSLNDPLPDDGPYEISELDIRCAMASYEVWRNRAFDTNTPGSFNEALRTKWQALQGDINEKMKQLFANYGDAGANAMGAAIFDPNLAEIFANKEQIVEDLRKLHGFVANLGNTYYGKQFIAKLKQTICWYKDGDEDNMEIYYSDTPTNAGGWIDNGPVLALNDPELGFFRQDDGRVGCFARFNKNGDVDEEPPAPSATNSEFPQDDVSPPESEGGGGGE